MDAFSSGFASPAGVVALACALAAPLAQAQNFPNRPIRVVVANAPGGNADLVSRMAAEAISRDLAQPVVVENQIGGRQIPGTLFVARATPDGHTLLGIGLVFAVNAGLYNDLPYDSLKDFTAVGMVGFTPQLVVVAPSFPANGIRELIALAKARPDTIHYSSTGIGGTAHLAGELLKTMAGIQLVHVPYKGTAQANADAAAGVVEISIAAPSSVLPLIKGGKLKALGISSARRSPQLPDVATVAETVPGYEMTIWNGLVAPAATPRPIVGLLNNALNRGMSTPEMKEKITRSGVDINPMAPEQMHAYLETEIRKWAKLVKEVGIEGER